MSSSSDEGNITLDMSYSQRDEWKDVKPIDQNDGPNDIVRIAYTEVFKEVYGYLRAVLKSNEISERAFDLSKDAALLNPANYTVWYYRRILLKALNKDLNQEIQFITEVIDENPKNYQVWQHRRCIVDLLNDPKDELEFTRKILKQDSKNYHAWQYRQYVIRKFDLWSGELDYVDELINTDIRNNSAWNQRYFIINNTQDINDDNLKLIYDEVNYCKDKIDKVIDNESVWNYLKAFTRNLSFENYPKDFLKYCLDLYNSNDDDARSPFLLSFLCDYYELKLNRMIEQGPQADEFKDCYNKAIGIFQQLATKYDVIRERYWAYVLNNWQTKYSKYLQ